MQWARKQTGFTIVELLIVVVVIAILAAITIVAYNGITNRAKESSVASEVSQGLKKVEAFKAASSTGSYPTTPTEAGVVNIQGLDYFYSGVAPESYCIQSVDGTITYSATNKATNPIKGTCAENGLIGWWRLNGNGNDSSGNNWTATLTGTAGIGQNGQADGAYAFNGATPTGAITGADNILTPEHTFSFWYYANSWNAGSATSFIAKRNGSSTGQFIARLTSGGVLIIDCGGQGNRWTTSSVLPMSAWTHVVVACSPTEVTAYVQGVSIGTAQRMAGPLANSTPLYFAQDASQYALNGRMDDIRLFNRVLTQSEVTNLFNAGAQ